MTIAATTAAAVVPRLPVHLSHFIGRERELADLVALLPTTRLLTLTGAGGSGKTRLAGEVASRVAGDFARTVWVDLAPLSDGALVTTQIANTMQVAERAGVSALECIVAEVGTLRLLLVIDNCEHVIDACASAIETLLRECPAMTVLCTSREALSITSETAWLIPPLVNAEAVQLFVERATAALPSFRLTPQSEPAVAEICQRLDGLPLAIELAAARVRVLAPAAIAERLVDAFKLLNAGSRTALPRQRTLRGTMDWSHQLLHPREQALFRRLSVFAGSFSLDAAEYVCHDSALASEDVLDGVAALVDKSLVVMEARDTEARYHLLETVRQYAAERLEAAGEGAAVQRRHVDYFLALMERLEPLLLGGEEVAGTVDSVHRDADNLRTALAWTRGAPDRGELGLKLVGALYWYWYGVGQFVEAKAFIDDALARRSADGDPLVLGRASLSRGLVALAQGDFVETRVYLGRARALLQEHGGTEINLLTAELKFAASYVLGGSPETALQLLAPLETRARASDHPSPLAFWLFWSGWSALLLGDLPSAKRLLNQTVEHGRRVGSETTIAHGVALLGRLALMDQDIPGAVGHLRDGLARHRTMGESWGLSLTLGGLATIASLRGDHATAARLQGGLDALRHRFGMIIPQAERPERERLLDVLRESLDGAFDELYRAGAEMGRDALAELALSRVAAEVPAKEESTTRFATTTGIRSVPTTDNVPLRVQALGGLQVFRGADLLETSAWGSARPRELLMYLLLHPDGVSKEQVGLAFWPEASTTQLRNNFHVTLHRLRKVLGGPGSVIVHADRYRVAPDVVGEFDVALFEADATAAQGAISRGDPSASALLDQAISRYGGDLLDGEPAGDWHQPFRDRLRSRFLDAAFALGDWQMQEERYPRAVETFRRVLARDELHEGAVRALMLSLVRLGERAQALRSYERVVKLLRKELDAAPEAETVLLAQRIQQGATE